VSSRVRWHARWVLPVAAPPIADGTVVTQGAHIVWVGPRLDAPMGDRDEELGDAILTPGLVNAHTHLDLTAMRGLITAGSFYEWVRTLIAARRELTDADLLDAAMLGVAEGLAAGITTYGDTSPASASFEAMLALGVRGIAFREVFGPDPEERAASMHALRVQVSSMRARATPLVRVGVSPHAPYSVSDELFLAVATFAAQAKLPVAVHIAESAEEVALVTQGTGPFADLLRSRDIDVRRRGDEPLDLMAANGLLRPRTLLIHCVQVSGAAVELIAGAGCGVAHCPQSNARLGAGTAPLVEFIAAGARVGLGSDSMASNDRMDLFEEARFAATAQRARTGRSDVISARAALRLITLGGAEALRLDAEVGSLSIGKQADLAVFAMSDLDVTDDPAAALVLTDRPRRAQRVIVAGQERVRDGVVLGFDQATTARVSVVGQRLVQWRSALASS